MAKRVFEAAQASDRGVELLHRFVLLQCNRRGRRAWRIRGLIYIVLVAAHASWARSRWSGFFDLMEANGFRFIRRHIAIDRAAAAAAAAAAARLACMVMFMHPIWPDQAQQALLERTTKDLGASAAASAAATASAAAAAAVRARPGGEPYGFFLHQLAVLDEVGVVDGARSQQAQQGGLGGDEKVATIQTKCCKSIHSLNFANGTPGGKRLAGLASAVVARDVRSSKCNSPTHSTISNANAAASAAAAVAATAARGSRYGLGDAAAQEPPGMKGISYEKGWV